jgi:hypothetical protein
METEAAAGGGGGVKYAFRSCLILEKRDVNPAKNMALHALLLGRREAKEEVEVAGAAGGAPVAKAATAATATAQGGGVAAAASSSSAAPQQQGIGEAKAKPQPLPSVFVSVKEAKLRKDYRGFKVELAPRERFVKFVLKLWRDSAHKVAERSLPNVTRLWLVLRHVSARTVDEGGMTKAKPFEVFAATLLPRDQWPRWCDDGSALLPQGYAAPKCSCSRSTDAAVAAKFRAAVKAAKDKLAGAAEAEEEHDESVAGEGDCGGSDCDKSDNDDDDDDDGDESEDEDTALPGQKDSGRH